MVSGFGGGAIFPLFAAMTADHFGENNNASNYGMFFALAGSIGLASVVLAAVPTGSGVAAGTEDRADSPADQPGRGLSRGQGQGFTARGGRRDR